MVRAVIKRVKKPDPIALKRKEIELEGGKKLRSPCSYYTRSATSWLIVFASYGVFNLQVIVYAGAYGPEQTLSIIQSWFISMGTALLVIEPFNICMVAALPILVSEQSCIWSCYQRCFHCYNEYFA